ncbi:MAG: TIGR01777 family oxidoreductase, partial [Phycisphaeraceae bacterium]
MSSEVFERSVELPVSAEQAFAWHEREGALPRLTPPWEQIELEKREGTIRDGDRTTLRMRVGPTWQRWVAEHRDYQPGRCFRDVQISGPFTKWEHEHRFEPIDSQRCRMTDRIEYVAPGGRIGQWLGHGAIARKLAKTFAWRHRTLANDLHQQKRYADRPPLTVAMTGASGLVGSAMTTLLTTAGHRVRPMVRRATDDPQAIVWNTREGVVDPQQMADVDVVIHLAGESLMGRWTAKKKQAIRDSRVAGTQALVRSLERAEPRPRTLLSTSALGYYGDRGDETMDESKGPGEGFLAEVAQGWEAAAMQAGTLGMRVALMRLGVVLTPRGAALKTMLTPFKMGGGGVIGSGGQIMSWVSLDDVLGAFYHALMQDDVAGAVNVNAPNTVTNRVFTKTLGKVIHRPTFIPVPAPMIRTVMGEMGQEMLLSSTNMQPAR